MNIFIAYRFTGENRKELQATIGELANYLSRLGHTIFCSLNLEEYFQANNFTKQQIYDYCLEKQKDYDCLLAIVKSDKESYGMKLEVEKAIELSQPIILIIRKDLNFLFFRKHAKTLFEFTDFTEIYKDLNTLTL